MSGGSEVTAVRFATVRTKRSANFLRFAEYLDLADETFDCDFYFWVVQSGNEVTLFDTGFGGAVARRRGIGFADEVPAALGRLGIGPLDVSRIVLSHLHFDHSGNLAKFPRAEIVIQQAELDLWLGPLAARRLFANVSESEDRLELRRAQLEGRVRAVQGDAKLTDEISAIFLPGHTPGSQGLRVETAGRPVVLAADAVHYYEELRLDMPFLYADNLAAMYQSFDRLRGLEAAGDVLVPGHASEVTTRFASRTLGGGCEYVRLL